LVTGSGLSREPSRGATRFAAERARAAGGKVLLDLDVRAELWPDMRAYSSEVRALLPLVDVVLGTVEEVEAAVGAEGMSATGPSELSDALRDGIDELLGAGPNALVVKRGARSTLVFPRGGRVVEAATFPVEVLNVLGAGDAFAGGFLYGYLKGWDFLRAARMGNACGAIVVTRHGCANFMPYEREALSFIEERGGF
ncbi:MAG TPA: PfkB family carbohydrate kinase, partial [Pyrinomonadaceae bacterium]|nr:PfkB family carbohydrate kinase [Pyrinomonadaceae bacterium]